MPTMSRQVILIFFLPFFSFGQSISSLTKAELTKCYSLAIADYVKTVYKEHKITFDTLYFGKHDQFPNLKLPGKIENTNIKFLSPENGLKLQRERKSIYYINMIGWGTREKYEFMFVTFTHSSAHQFDWHVNYTYKAKKKVFELHISSFDYYWFKK